MESPAYEEICPEFLRVLPRLRYKKNISASTNRNMYPINRAGGRSRTRNPAEIGCPEGPVIQWLPGPKSDDDRLGKKRGPGCPRRRFGHFFAEEKVTRGLGPGRPQWQAPGAQPPLKNVGPS